MDLELLYNEIFMINQPFIHASKQCSSSTEMLKNALVVTYCNVLYNKVWKSILKLFYTKINFT